MVSGGAGLTLSRLNSWRMWVVLEVDDQRGVGVFESDDYRFGVALSSLGAGVGVVDGEEGGGLFGAEGFEAVGLDGGHVDEGDVLVGGQLADVGVVAHVAFDLDFPSGPSFQMLRMVMERRMGVAFLARVSAMYLRMYQP